MDVSLMNIPAIKGKKFKIRCKADARIFIEKCMNNDNSYTIIIREDYALVFEKDSNGNVDLYYKKGNLRDPFNPLVHLGSVKNGQINNLINDYVWSCRKQINAKWFT